MTLAEMRKILANFHNAQVHNGPWSEEIIEEAAGLLGIVMRWSDCEIAEALSLLKEIAQYRLEEKAAQKQAAARWN